MNVTSPNASELSNEGIATWYGILKDEYGEKFAVDYLQGFHNTEPPQRNFVVLEIAPETMKRSLENRTCVSCKSPVSDKKTDQTLFKDAGQPKFHLCLKCRQLE
jgi:hypothetical protein